MKNIYRLFCVLSLASCFASAAVSQTASTEALLSVGGEVPTALKLTRADLD